MPPFPMKLWKKIAVALTVATLLYGGQIRMYTDNWNRFLEYWEFADGLSIILGILLLSLVVFAAQWLVASLHWPWLNRISQHLFLLAFGTGLISSLFTYVDYKVEFVNLVMVGLVVFSWCRPQARIVRRAATVALILSPLALISFVELLRFPDWAAPLDKLPGLRPAMTNNSTPVFVFVFDEWSYARSTTNGQFLPAFPNLRRLSEQSFFFQEACSPAARTHQSVPRLLYQNDFASVKIGRDKMFVETGGKWSPTDETASLFLHARENNYQSYILGFYLPYRKILGNQVDVCRGYPGEPKAGALLQNVGSRFLKNIKFWMDPVSLKLARTLNRLPVPNSKVAYSRFWFNLNHNLRDDAFSVIDHAPNNSFLFAHMIVPHSPFIFKADGGYHGPYKAGRMSGNIEDYKRSLQYLDKLVGEFMDRLKAAGKFDDAFIILTSDHSWRMDYTRDGVLSDSDEVRHVPLVIKCPQQKIPRQVAETFPLVQLGSIIDSVLGGKGDDATVLDLLRQNVPPAKKPHRAGPEPKAHDEDTPASAE